MQTMRGNSGASRRRDRGGVPLLRFLYDVSETCGQQGGTALQPGGTVPAQQRFRPGGAGLQPVHPVFASGSGRLLGPAPVAFRHRICGGSRHARKDPHLSPGPGFPRHLRPRLSASRGTCGRLRPGHLRTGSEADRRDPTGDPGYFGTGKALRRLHLLQGIHRRGDPDPGLRGCPGDLLPADESGLQGIFLAHHPRRETGDSVRALHFCRPEFGESDAGHREPKGVLRSRVGPERVEPLHRLDEEEPRQTHHPLLQGDEPLRFASGAVAVPGAGYEQDRLHPGSSARDKESHQQRGGKIGRFRVFFRLRQAGKPSPPGQALRGKRRFRFREGVLRKVPRSGC